MAVTLKGITQRSQGSQRSRREKHLADATAAIAGAVSTESQAPPKLSEDELNQIAFSALSSYPADQAAAGWKEAATVRGVAERRGAAGLKDYGSSARATRRTARLAAQLAPAGTPAASTGSMEAMDYANPDHLRRAALAGGLRVGDQDRLGSDDAYRQRRADKLGFSAEALKDPGILAQAQGLGLAEGPLLAALRKRRKTPANAFQNSGRPVV